MKTESFGLDIGTTAIKAVFLKRDAANKPVLQSSFTVPTSPKGLRSDAPDDQAALAQVLRNALSDNPIPTTNVSIALTDNQVYTKVVELPILSQKELSSAVYWEAEQSIPVPLSTITLDWQLLQQDEATTLNPKMHVLLVGAQIAVVKRYQSVLELAGLNTVSVETETLAIIRAVSSQNASSFFLINLGANTTSFAILKNGILVFTYSIPIGSIAMNRAIATEFGFSFEQAEEYKKTYGLADKTIGQKIGTAIEPILFSMLSEIKKALAFYQDKYKAASSLSQILLTGATAKMPGIDLFFAQNCGIETVVANPWAVHAIQNVTPQLLESGPEYAVAVGLALKEHEE